MSAPKGTAAERRQRKEAREASKKALSERQKLRKEASAANKIKKEEQKKRGAATRRKREMSQRQLIALENRLLSGKRGKDKPLSEEQNVQSKLLKLAINGGEWKSDYKGPNAALYNKLGKMISPKVLYGKGGLLKSAQFAATTLVRAKRDEKGKLIKVDGKTVKEPAGKTLQESQQKEAVKRALLKTMRSIEKGTLPKGGKVKAGKTLEAVNEKTLGSYFQRTVMTQARISKYLTKAETKIKGEEAQKTLGTAKGRGGEKPKGKIGGKRPTPR